MISASHHFQIGIFHCLLPSIYKLTSKIIFGENTNLNALHKTQKIVRLHWQLKTYIFTGFYGLYYVLKIFSIGIILRKHTQYKLLILHSIRSTLFRRWRHSLGKSLLLLMTGSMGFRKSIFFLLANMCISFSQNTQTVSVSSYPNSQTCWTSSRGWTALVITITDLQWYGFCIQYFVSSYYNTYGINITPLYKIKVIFL